ncbi:MAG: hypothetical protein QM473_09685 [Acidobacteriota bacterium]|nr:hypothetical protein [Acidobacteriota bacterium]
MRDFVFGHYKESAQPIWDLQMMMWDYWRKWHKLPHKCGVASSNPLLNNLQCSYAPDGPMFTSDFMQAMRGCLTQAERLAASDVIRDHVERAKLPLLYLELSQKLGYYTEFGDFSYGDSINKTRADRQALQPLLDEFSALCRKHELTTLGIPITVDRIVGKWQACIDAENPGQPRVFLPAEWIFRADPRDVGVRDQWFADPQPFRASGTLTIGEERERPLPRGLAWVHINRGVGWEQQGFPGLDGYGWYFQNLRVPDDLAGRQHLYLYFRGVNEQAWVYINGQQAFERTYESTGKGVGELTGAPFSFDAAQWLKPGVENEVAIRVTHATGLGGICFPAMLIATDEERATAELDAYRQ